MDDIIFEALCNTVVEVTYLSEAGFLTRGMFSNNPAYIPRGRERGKGDIPLNCFELYRGRLVKIRNETEIHSAILKSPPQVRGPQLIYGECQPSRQWVKEQLKSFSRPSFPFEKELLEISDKHKLTALEFFSGNKISRSMGKLSHLIDDLVCSQIFEKAPKSLLAAEFLAPGGALEDGHMDFARGQWERLIKLFIELHVIQIRKDKLKAPKEKRTLINKVQNAPLGGLKALRSVSELAEYWPPELGKKPGVIFS